MKGASVFTPVFSSRLAPAFARYVDLKRALGRRFDLPARTLQSLDRFLCDQSAKYSDLNADAFQAWCHTHEHVTSGVRRVRMLEVRSFCLYRHRAEPQCFVPDPSFFPPYHQRLKPYIFSAAEVGKLPQCGCTFETESGIAAASGTDSAGDRSSVHHGNAARGTAEPNAG